MSLTNLYRLLKRSADVLQSEIKALVFQLQPSRELEDCLLDDQEDFILFATLEENAEAMLLRARISSLFLQREPTVWSELRPNLRKEAQWFDAQHRGFDSEFTCDVEIMVKEFQEFEYHLRQLKKSSVSDPLLGRLVNLPILDAPCMDEINPALVILPDLEESRLPTTKVEHDILRVTIKVARKAAFLAQLALKQSINPSSALSIDRMNEFVGTLIEEETEKRRLLDCLVSDDSLLSQRKARHRFVTYQTYSNPQRESADSLLVHQTLLLEALRDLQKDFEKLIVKALSEGAFFKECEWAAHLAGIRKSRSGNWMWADSGTEPTQHLNSFEGSEIELRMSQSLLLAQLEIYMLDLDIKYWTQKDGA